MGQKAMRKIGVALHWVAISGYEMAVRLLLKYGVNINERDKDGYTEIWFESIPLVPPDVVSSTYPWGGGRAKRQHIIIYFVFSPKQ